MSEPADLACRMRARSETVDSESTALLLSAGADEIIRLRMRLSKIENAPVDPGNIVAMTLKGWAAPRDGEPANG